MKKHGELQLPLPRMVFETVARGPKRFGVERCPTCKKLLDNGSKVCNVCLNKRRHPEEEDRRESQHCCSRQRVSVDDSDDLGFEMAEFDAAVVRQRIGRDYDVLVETVNSDDEDEDEEDATNVDIDDNYERNSGALCWMYRCDGDEETHNRRSGTSWKHGTG